MFKQEKCELVTRYPNPKEDIANRLCIVDEYPKGFPELAALIGSDDDLAMHRNFKYCHNRVLLHLEVQITELEKNLFNLDKKDEVDEDRQHRLRWTEHEEGWNTEQLELLEKLIAKLKEYGEHRARI
jgi:hypothetical protein